MLGAIIGGIGLAKSIFGKKPTAQTQGASPFMVDDSLKRYMLMKDILKQTRSNAYLEYLNSKRGGEYGGY